jgi:RNA polymerase sigma-70 factor, ECF subfamily
LRFGGEKGRDIRGIDLAEVRLLQSSAAWGREEAESIVARARDGEEGAYLAIFNRYAKPVQAFIFNLLGDRGRAEELTQETFYRAFRRLESMRPETELSTWLFGIARNVVRESIKGRYREQRRIAPEDPAGLNLEDQRLGADQLLISNEFQQAIGRALDALSLDHRLVFVLKAFHSMSYQEISRITGCSVGKLKTDLRRARQEIRRRLGPYLQDSGVKSRGEP